MYLLVYFVVRLYRRLVLQTNFKLQRVLCTTGRMFFSSVVEYFLTLCEDVIVVGFINGHHLRRKRLGKTSRDIEDPERKKGRIAIQMQKKQDGQYRVR